MVAVAQFEFRLVGTKNRYVRPLGQSLTLYHDLSRNDFAFRYSHALILPVTFGPLVFAREQTSGPTQYSGRRFRCITARDAYSQRAQR
jgi:hypothetical protein